jgi:hypothetical protein
MQLIQFTVLANLVLIQIHCTVKLVFRGHWTMEKLLHKTSDRLFYIDRCGLSVPVHNDSHITLCY